MADKTQIIYCTYIAELEAASKEGCSVVSGWPFLYIWAGRIGLSIPNFAEGMQLSLLAIRTNVVKKHSIRTANWFLQQVLGNLAN